MSSPSLNNKRVKKANRVLIAASLLFLSLFIVISMNIFYVAIVGTHFHSKTDINVYAQNIYTQRRVLLAPRGQIFDRNGNIIAQDVISYTLIAILSESRVTGDGRPAYVDDKENTAKALAPILQMDENTLLNYFNRSLYQTELGVRGRNLSLNQKTAIEQLRLPGLIFQETLTRNYPLGVFASHLIGFAQFDAVGRTMSGKMGIESHFNEMLSGMNGFHEYQSDTSGYVYKDMFQSYQPAIAGMDITLTLDKGIQESLELAFAQTSEQFKAKLVWGSVMEIATGKMLAWGHAPSFDPNRINITDYNNIGAQYAYEPGSTMKSFTYAAAIDAGVYQGDKLYNGNSFMMGIANGLPIRVTSNALAISTINNANRRDYGMVSFDYGYMASLNTAIAELLSTTLAPSVFDEYLQRFGFFQTVNTNGLLETRGTKNFRYPIEMITTGYGQGSSVTMLQLMQAYSALFSDGTMVKPYFVDKIFDPLTQSTIYQGQTTVVGHPIQPHTAQKMQELMDRTFNDGGTAQRYRIPEVDLMGKTGTAQVAVDGKYDNSLNIYSVMAALPADNPTIMVYYAFMAPPTNRAHIDTAAIGGLFRKIAISYNFSNQPDNNDPNLPLEILTIPNFSNRPIQDAIHYSAIHQVPLVILGNGQYIVKQSPSVNQKVYSSQRIFVLTDNNSFVMPDMTDWTLKDITQFWSLTGYPVNIHGSGTVKSQNILPNTPLTKEVKLEVHLENKP